MVGQYSTDSYAKAWSTLWFFIRASRYLCKWSEGSKNQFYCQIEQDLLQDLYRKAGVCCQILRVWFMVYILGCQ